MEEIVLKDILNNSNQITKVEEVISNFLIKKFNLEIPIKTINLPLIRAKILIDDHIELNGIELEILMEAYVANKGFSN